MTPEDGLGSAASSSPRIKKMDKTQNTKGREETDWQLHEGTCIRESTNVTWKRLELIRSLHSSISRRHLLPEINMSKDTRNKGIFSTHRKRSPCPSPCKESLSTYGTKYPNYHLEKLSFCERTKNLSADIRELEQAQQEQIQFTDL